MIAFDTTLTSVVRVTVQLDETPRDVGCPQVTELFIHTQFLD